MPLMFVTEFFFSRMKVNIRCDMQDTMLECYTDVHDSMFINYIINE